MKPFRNASDRPDGELNKEVYAHFGLCMYMAQVFETGLINILTALETRASKQPTRATFDQLYAKHESLTFGNLMAALGRREFLPGDLIAEVRRLKAARDHLAHRFFRDHALNFVTVGGCYTMIEELDKLRDEFDSLEHRVHDFVVPAMERLGFTSRYQQEDIERSLNEAKSRYSSSVLR